MARLRQVTRERSIGHAGTLDPRATGLLVMLLGKATRLATLLSGHDKTYEAEVRLGWATTTDDAAGERIGAAPSGAPKGTPYIEPGDISDDALLEALTHYRGTFEQMPPQHSAKKIDGHKAYDLARQDKHVALKTSTVTMRSLELIDRSADLVRLTMTVSAGFYVRSLARDLGEQLGCGAHLSALRRTRSGGFQVEAATTLDEADQLGPLLEPRLISLADALPELPAVQLSDVGLTKVKHGNPVGQQLVTGQWVPAGAGTSKVRLLDESGTLVALADCRGGLLHPSVVLV